MLVTALVVAASLSESCAGPSVLCVHGVHDVPDGPLDGVAEVLLVYVLQLGGDLCPEVVVEEAFEEAQALDQVTVVVMQVWLEAPDQESPLCLSFHHFFDAPVFVGNSVSRYSLLVLE